MCRVWADPAVHKRVVADPRGALLELGVPVPDGVAVRIVGSKGAPSDVDDPSLIQFVLEQGTGYAYFFLPSPRSPCAQQAAYGRILTKTLDDPEYDRRVRADADRALRGLAAQSA